MHERGGIVEMDGDRLDVDYIPVNYDRSLAPSEVSNAQHLTAHLRGIDNELAGMSTMGPTDEYIQDLVGKMFVDGLQTGVRLTYDDANAEIDSSITNEYVYDLVGGMFTGNTFTGGASLHRDSANKIDFRIDFPTPPVAPDIPWTAVPSNIISDNNSQRNLGSTSFQWRHSYINRMYTQQIYPLDDADPIIVSADLDIEGHVGLNDHAIYGLAQITRSSENTLSLPASLGGLSSLEALRANLPAGSLLIGEDEEMFMSLFDDIFNAIFQDIPNVTANFLDSDDHGRLFIRVGNNIYIFHSDSRISLTGA